MFEAGELLDTREQLRQIEGLRVRTDEPLARHTRFAIGGPADLFVTADSAVAFAEALQLAKACGIPTVVIGGGSNLVVSDTGFRGMVLQLAAAGIERNGTSVTVDSGAALQSLVDFTIDEGLRGLETMTGIPGWAGAAVYGNAGAYGHSISERISAVRFLAGFAMREFDNAACDFEYRESIFKRNKDWTIVQCVLQMDEAPSMELRAKADGIRKIRDEKYPPTMKCAGSIFKNLLFADLPPHVQAIVPANVVREGKVPSAWFLEQVGAKGMRVGDIQVADYHANLIYNDGAGTARDVATIITRLKDRVLERFGMAVEEEVQYVGDFDV